MTPILIIRRWPDIPGHDGGTRIHSGYKKAESVVWPGYWLVREKGLFKRWRWLPVKGAYVELQLVK